MNQQNFYLIIALCAILQTLLVSALIIAKFPVPRGRWRRRSIERLDGRLDRLEDELRGLDILYTSTREQITEDHERINGNAEAIARRGKEIFNLAERVNDLQNNYAAIWTPDLFPHDTTKKRFEALESSLNVLKNDFSGLSSRLDGLAENHFILGSAVGSHIDSVNKAIQELALFKENCIKEQFRQDTLLKSLGERLHTLAGQVGTDVLERLESVEMRLSDTRERLKL